MSLQIKDYNQKRKENELQLQSFFIFLFFQRIQKVTD